MRAALYARVSSADLGATIETEQLPELRRYAELRGWPVIVERSDVTPEAAGKRPGFEALLDDVGAGRVDIVVCESLHRLFRDVLQLARYGREWSEHGVRVVSIRQAFDATTAPGWARFLDAVSLVESLVRERLRERALIGALRSRLTRGDDAIGRPRRIVNPLEVRDLWEAGLSEREAVKRARALGSTLSQATYRKTIRELLATGQLDQAKRDAAIEKRGGLRRGGRRRASTVPPDLVAELWEEGRSRRQIVLAALAKGYRATPGAIAAEVARLRSAGKVDDERRREALEAAS